MHTCRTKVQPTKNRIGLIGARFDGHASVVVDILRDLEPRCELFFFDDTPQLIGKSVMGIKVVGLIEDIFKGQWGDIDSFHICIGNNEFRSKLYLDLIGQKKCLVNVIHPSAWISPEASLSMGVYIGPMVSVNSGVKIGSVSILNTGVVVDHNCEVGIAAHLAPRSCLTGRVFVGDGAFIGAGAVVVPDIKIGERAFIHAGAVITADIPPNSIVRR